MQIAITMDNKEKVSALRITELERISGIHSFCWHEKGHGDRLGASLAIGHWERLCINSIELITIKLSGVHHCERGRATILFLLCDPS